MGAARSSDQFTMLLPHRLLPLSLVLFSLSACDGGAPPASSTASNEQANAVEPASAKAQSFAYVSNQDAGVSIIDIKTMTAVGTIDPGAEGPRGIGISEDGKLLVTANRGGGNLSVIDRESGKLLRQIEIGQNPEFVRVRGNQAFVTFEPAAVGGPPPKPGSPEALALEKQREDEDTEPAQIAVVDLLEGVVTRRIVGGMETEGIEFSADGQKILVTNEADDTISVHDIATGSEIKSIDIKPYGVRPRGIKIGPDGQKYFATLEHANKVLVLDAEFEPVTTFDTGNVPYGISFDAKGEKLFVALAHGKALEVFDAKTYESIKRIPTGDRCWHFSFTPDNAQIMVACGRSHELVVIDAQSLEVVKRLGDKHLPWGIVTWPHAQGSLDTP